MPDSPRWTRGSRCRIALPLSRFLLTVGLLLMLSASWIAASGLSEPPAAVADAMPTPIQTGSKLALNGIGSVRIGMKLLPAVDATGDGWSIESRVSDGDCRYARPQKAPSALNFMAVDGVIVRAEVHEKGITTVSGAGVGDTEERIKSLYPKRLTVRSHPYNEQGHYLTFVPADKKDAKFRLIFETDGEKVTSFRCGRVPEVEWIEGCL